MTRAELNTYVDENVTDKTAIDSLSPIDEGNSIKAVADYVDDNFQKTEDLTQDVDADSASTTKYPSAKAVADYVASEIQNVKPYKVYSILISQTGTSNPVVTTLLENTFEGTITWTRTSAGRYLGTINTTEFTNLKTGFIVTPVGVDLNYGMFSPSSSTVTLDTWVPSSSGFSDGQLNETFLEIRVYP